MRVPENLCERDTRERAKVNTRARTRLNIYCVCTLYGSTSGGGGGGGRVYRTRSVLRRRYIYIYGSYTVWCYMYSIIIRIYCNTQIYTLYILNTYMCVCVWHSCCSSLSLYATLLPLYRHTHNEPRPAFCTSRNVRPGKWTICLQPPPPLYVTLSLSLACANQNLIRSTQPDTPRPERIIICASCTRPIPCEAQYNIVCIRACITFNIAGELSVSVTRFEIDFIARDRYTIEIWKIYLKRFQKSKRVRTIVLYLLIHFRNRCNGNYYLCTYHVVSALKRL